MREQEPMKLIPLVFREMSRKKGRLISSLTAVSLGIAVIVGIVNITHYSEKAVASALDALGANILILPKSASVADYYSADFQESTIPESYVGLLTNSDMKGLDNLSPKLSMPVTIQGVRATLTGILPRSEFKSKAMWQGALNVFSRPEGCGTPVEIPGMAPKRNFARKRVIEDLGLASALVGSESAARNNLKEGDSLVLDNGATFSVEAILPATGTVDDERIFAHLRTVQTLAKKDSALNVIEIVGCCNAIAGGLIQKINKLLPDAKVVTISQIVQTQLHTNNLMKNLSLILLIIILVAGGASIANYLFADASERRREIGILAALGADSVWITRMFLLKGATIGTLGGMIGFLLGSVLAMALGPAIAGVRAMPMPLLAVAAIVMSAAVSTVSALIPAVSAAKVDPFSIIREE